MTEEQGDRIIELLEYIHAELEDIQRNTSNIPNTMYNNSDVCSKLDNVERAIKNID